MRNLTLFELNELSPLKEEYIFQNTKNSCFFYLVKKWSLNWEHKNRENFLDELKTQEEYLYKIPIWCLALTDKNKKELLNKFYQQKDREWYSTEGVRVKEVYMEDVDFNSFFIDQEFQFENYNENLKYVWQAREYELVLKNSIIICKVNIKSPSTSHYFKDSGLFKLISHEWIFEITFNYDNNTFNSILMEYNESDDSNGFEPCDHSVDWYDGDETNGTFYWGDAD